MQRPRMFSQPWCRAVALWGAMSLVLSVQRGAITITAANNATATIAAVDPANSLIHWLGMTNASFDEREYWCRVELTNATTVTANRYVAQVGGTTSTVNFEVIEFRQGVIRSIQRGATAIAASPTDVTLTQVSDMGKTTVELLGWTDGSGTGISYILPVASLTSVTNLRLTTGATSGNQTFGWQVVEWN